MLTALDHVREMLRGLQSIADTVLDAAPARAPARVAAASVLEEELRECLGRLAIDVTGRDVAHRFLLTYRVNLRAMSSIGVRRLGLAHPSRATVLRREADEAHTRCVIALGGIATLLRDARSTDRDPVTLPLRRQLFA